MHSTSPFQVNGDSPVKPGTCFKEFIVCPFSPLSYLIDDAFCILYDSFRLIIAFRIVTQVMLMSLCYFIWLL